MGNNKKKGQPNDNRSPGTDTESFNYKEMYEKLLTEIQVTAMQWIEDKFKNVTVWRTAMESQLEGLAQFVSAQSQRQGEIIKSLQGLIETNTKMANMTIKWDNDAEVIATCKNDIE